MQNAKGKRRGKGKGKEGKSKLQNKTNKQNKMKG